MSSAYSRAAVFPLPIFRSPPYRPSPSRRCQQRHNASLESHALANLCIRSLNHLSASFGSASIPVPTSFLQPQSQSQFLSATNSANLHHKSFDTRNLAVSNASHALTSVQSRLLSHVYGCATRFLRRRGDSSGLSVRDGSDSLSVVDY